MKSHSFAAQYKYSQGLSPKRKQDALKEHILSHHHFEPANEQEDRSGSDDFSIDSTRKHRLGIDFKRRRPRFQGDVILEFSSGYKPGWAIADTATDAYLITHDDGTTICLPARPLRRIMVRNLSNWKRRFRIITTRTGRSFYSSCVAVPFSILHSEMAADKKKYPLDHRFVKK